MALSRSTGERLFDAALEQEAAAAASRPSILETVARGGARARAERRDAAGGARRPRGEETIATIDALVAGSPAAAPELARARTIGERTAVARSVASTLPLGIEAFDSFTREQELTEQNAPLRRALGGALANPIKRVPLGAKIQARPRRSRTEPRALSRLARLSTRLQDRRDGRPSTACPRPRSSCSPRRWRSSYAKRPPGRPQSWRRCGRSCAGKRSTRRCSSRSSRGKRPSAGPREYARLQTRRKLTEELTRQLAGLGGVEASGPLVPEPRVDVFKSRMTSAGTSPTNSSHTPAVLQRQSDSCMVESRSTRPPGNRRRRTRSGTAVRCRTGRRTCARRSHRRIRCAGEAGRAGSRIHHRSTDRGGARGRGRRPAVPGRAQRTQRPQQGRSVRAGSTRRSSAASRPSSNCLPRESRSSVLPQPTRWPSSTGGVLSKASPGTRLLRKRSLPASSAAGAVPAGLGAVLEDAVLASAVTGTLIGTGVGLAVGGAQASLLGLSSAWWLTAVLNDLSEEDSDLGAAIRRSTTRRQAVCQPVGRDPETRRLLEQQAKVIVEQSSALRPRSDSYGSGFSCEAASETPSTALAARSVA